MRSLAVLAFAVGVAQATGCGRIGFDPRAWLAERDGGSHDGAAVRDGAPAEGGGADARLTADVTDGSSSPGDTASDLPRDATPDVAPDRPPPDVTLSSRPPACSPGACKRVFVTRATMPHGGFGGSGTANAHCQSRADAERLGGTWKAWLSDARQTPRADFTRASVPYRLLDGTLVANDWMDLTRGAMAHAIDMYETGEPVPVGVEHEVWTGTSPSGASTGSSCADWTNTTDQLPYATVGLSSRTTDEWTEVYLQFCDRTDIRLYCFEQ